MQFKLELVLDARVYTWWSQPFIVFSNDTMITLNSIKTPIYIPAFPTHINGMCILDAFNLEYPNSDPTIVGHRQLKKDKINTEPIEVDVLIDMLIPRKKKSMSVETGGNVSIQKNLKPISEIIDLECLSDPIVIPKFIPWNNGLTKTKPIVI
jgi:hypothetical protein